jgi:molecular chaperone GrpE
MNASDNLEKHENIEPIEEPLDGGNGENLNTLSPDIKEFDASNTGVNIKQHTVSGDIEQEDIESLKEEIAILKKASENNLEKLRYLLADYDNYRKQMEKQMEGKIEQAKGGVLSKIINIEDDFLRAINTLKDSRCSPAIVDGLNGILKNLNSLLLSEGVREIEALGTPFDPGVHDALSFTPTMDQPENTVIQVVRRGFMLNNKVLRPSLVILSRKIISNKDID